MTSTPIQLAQKIPDEMRGLRLDQALARLFPDYSRAQLQEWIRAGFVQINGQTIDKPKQTVTASSLVTIHAQLNNRENWQAQALVLPIVYEDDDILVINKPAGVVVHPGAGNPDHTLINAILHHSPQSSELPRAGIIHRLDKDTTGLLIAARNIKSYNALTQAMQQREIKREYVAIVRGQLISGGTIDAPIGRDPHARTRMSVHPQGKTAITHYRILERFAEHTYVSIKLETGRTHQIRVHFAHINHPIVGDPVYAKGFALSPKISNELKTVLQQFKRQALHAERIGFNHPVHLEWVSFYAEIPEDFSALLTILRKN